MNQSVREQTQTERMTHWKSSLHMTRFLVFHSTLNTQHMHFFSLQLLRREFIFLFFLHRAYTIFPCYVCNSIWSIAFVSQFYMHTRFICHFSPPLNTDATFNKINKTHSRCCLMEITLSELSFNIIHMALVVGFIFPFTFSAMFLDHEKVLDLEKVFWALQRDDFESVECHKTFSFQMNLLRLIWCCNDSHVKYFKSSLVWAH